MNECYWHILAGNDERINSHCLTRPMLSISMRNSLSNFKIVDYTLS